jgi:hypothetical protein
MANNFLRYGLLTVALSLALGVGVQKASSSQVRPKYFGEAQACPSGTHWESLPNMSNTQQGYRCAPDR